MNKIIIKKITPKILLFLLILSILSTFINIEPNKLFEINTVTYKNLITNDITKNNKTPIFYKYEFTFTHLDIIDTTNPNSDNTYNIERIEYTSKSSLFKFFNFFLFYYKAFISFTITLFVTILISFFFPISPTSSLNNLEKPQFNPNEIYNKKSNENIHKFIIYSIMVINTIPILVSMVSMICLNFKESLISDSLSLPNKLLKSICIDEYGNYFGYCSNDLNRNIKLEELEDHITIFNGYQYQHIKYEWKETITFIRITISYILVLLLFSLIVFSFYFYVIIDLKNEFQIKKQLKIKENHDLEMKQIQSKNSLQNKISDIEISKPNSSNTSSIASSGGDSIQSLN